LKQRWCIGSIDAQYLARMEDVLHLYNLPLDEKRPLICFDEQPLQLLGEVCAPLPMKKGQPARYDYEYERAGTASYASAEQIVLVQDNLNTHNASSFYENLEAAEAFRLAQKFEMHYTPKKGSWLNMAELELSALSRICLSRRIGSLEELDRQVQALVKERNELQVKVECQFSIAQAREKLSRHYEQVKSKD